MKITHYICPRNCGKTTFAKNLQMEDPENTLLYTMEYGTWSWGQPMRGERWKKVIMDEYILRYNKLSETDKSRFIDWINSIVFSRLIPNGELILISTSDKLYNSLLFLMLGQMKNSVSKIINYLRTSTVAFSVGEEQKSNLQQSIDEMRCKFLDPSMERLDIIKTDFGHNFNLLTGPEYARFKNYKNMYGEERYLTDIKGEFLK